MSVPGRKRPSSVVCDCRRRPELDDADGRLVVLARGTGVDPGEMATVSESCEVETGVAQDGQKRPPTGTSLLHFTQCCTAIRFSVAE